MSFAPITDTSVILIEGDSDTDPALTYQALNGVRSYIYGKFNTGRGNTFRVPKILNKATNGATTTTVAGRIAPELAVNPYTHVIFFLGINDPRNSITLGTSQANVATILTACSGKSVLWAGPLCSGELWPTGLNAFDAGIDALNAALITRIPAAGGVYVDVRTGVYGVREPLLNTASPGVAIGPLTRPDAAATHFNETGAAFVTQAITPFLTFA
jgi:hypothetical protein